MAALSVEEFRHTIRSRYESAAVESRREDLSAALDASLRERVATLWEKIVLLEALTLHPPTGDPAAIRLSFRGELDQLVETWQQSILALHRVTVSPNDPEFLRKVIARYSSPSPTVPSHEIARSLDENLAGYYASFWGLLYQLHLCAAELARSRDHDLAEQTRLNLQTLVRVWKQSLLSRPRARAETKTKSLPEKTRARGSGDGNQ